MRIRSAALVASAVGLTFIIGGMEARSEPSDRWHDDIEIKALSTKPWLVSGGDVLLEIRVPWRVRSREVQVTLNGMDVSDAFRPMARHEVPPRPARVARTSERARSRQE